MEDLRPGGPLRLSNDALAEDAFSWCKQLPALEKVAFGQLKACVEDHWMAAAKDARRVMQEQQRFDQRSSQASAQRERGADGAQRTPPSCCCNEI